MLQALVACALALTVQDSAAEPSPFEVHTTSLVRGPEETPRQVLRFELLREVADGARVRVLFEAGPGEAGTSPVATSREDGESGGAAGGALSAEQRAELESLEGLGYVDEESESRTERTFDASFALAPGQRTLDLLVPMAIAEGTRHATVTLLEGERWFDRRVAYTRPSLDWVLHFVPGFHYDPVWWNTQAHYTETGRFMDSHVGPGLELVEQYLEKCDEDPQWRAALHQLPYLKTFFEARPRQTERLLELVQEGRIGSVGGTYDELSTTLVSAEAVARNAAYGTLFQSEILGGRAHTFWQCDVFGHDPSFPSLMARSGHVNGAFARGPFHQWGAPRDQVNFPSEFLWMAPDGESVLTHYMTGHYGYAYAKFANGSNRASDDPDVTNAIIAEMFEDLKQPALTHHVMLPMHTDFIRPLENLGEIVRAWNAQYLSPKVVMDTGEEFFQAVREEIDAKGIVVPVITRDMNPIYTGCPVSFADLKQANRACETALREAEIWATVAAVQGADYPSLALDRAWRQLLFNAHHDGITGSMSDQVYVDIMAGYRDALDLATGVRERALAYLESRIDTTRAGSLVWNATGRPRRGWADTPSGRRVRQGAPVPALGYSPLVQAEASPRTASGTVLENEFFRVEIDLARGGTISKLVELASGRDLMAGAGNDLVLVEEYPVLPGHGEGPWHLAPTGEERPGTGVAATLLPPDPARPHRIEIEAVYPEFTKHQTIELLPGVARIDFETHVLDWKGRNQLLRAEFPLDRVGGRPVFQTAAAVIARTFARDVDTAVDSWTLDQTCWQWAGLGSVSTLSVTDETGGAFRVALGVGEIVVADGATSAELADAYGLAAAFVRSGVTTTVTRVGDRRYGDLALDSNLPDFRVFLGAGPAPTPARSNGDDLPWLVLPDSAAIAEVVASLDAAHGIDLPLADAAAWIQRGDMTPGDAQELPTVALVNRGVVSVHVTEEGEGEEAVGTLALNLMRSCTSWPSGTWMDPPERRLPDGAPFGTMHGSHVFRYSLVAGAGDYRDIDLNDRAQAVQHPLVAREVGRGVHAGELPPSASFLEVSPRGVTVAALKPAGFPEARWRLTEDVERPTRLALRLWNGTGNQTEARIELGRLAGEVRRAWRSDVLESEGEELAIENGVVSLSMNAHAYETLLLEGEPAPRDPEAPSLDPTEGDVAPSAYWLENRGEGVTANGVLSLTPLEREVVHADGTAEVALFVVNNDREREVVVDLTALAGEGTTVVLSPASVTVGPASAAEVALKIEGAPASRSLVTITAAGSGVLRPVTASVWFSEPGSDPYDPELVTLEVVNAAPIVSNGDALSAVVRNRTGGPIPAMVRWLLPMAMWDAVPDWTREVVVPADGEVVVSSPLGYVLDGWALLEVCFGGTVVYGETVALTSDREKAILSFDVDRVRVRSDEPGRALLLVRSLEGLDGNTPLGLEAPEGFAVREVERDFEQAGDTQLLAVELELTAEPGVLDIEGATRGDLRVNGPRGATAVAAYTIAPEQRALRAYGEVVIDGRLDDWTQEEFSETHDQLGAVRCAVRYGTGGLAIAYVVEDDVHRQPHANGSIWEGDSVQFALTVAPSTDFGYGGRDLEFGAALSPDGPLVWCWYGGDGGKTGRLDECEVAIVRDGERTIYEFKVPRALLPRIALEPDVVLGFSYIANDDDGEGYRGATQWTGGMVGGKDSSLFGELVLTL